jgi:hypothetical protein
VSERLETSPVACAWCGTHKRLWDEGDTLYCTSCARRTWVASGECALRRCRNCGEMRDAKAYVCFNCNLSDE